MTRPAYICTVIFLAFSLLAAGTAEADGADAGQGGEFLRYGVGARAMAMGGAYTSLADDATAVFWNPAGLAQLRRPSFQFMQTELYLDSRLMYGALAYPHYGFPDRGSKISLGLGMLGFRMEGFEPYSADDRFLGGSFDDSQMALTASVAYDRISHLGRLAAGMNILAFNHRLYGYGDWGAGADFGVLAQLINPPEWSLLGLIPIEYLLPWRFGAVLHTATGEELLRTEEDYPNTLSLGVSNSDLPVPHLPGRLTASYQFDRVLSTWRDDDHRLGCEYRLPLYGDFVFALRGGVHLSGGSDDGGGYSWGFGLRGCDISLMGWNGYIGLDFAQRDHQMLPSANFLSLKLIFGPSSPERRAFSAGDIPGQVCENNLIRSFIEYSRDPALSHPDSALAAETRKGYFGIGRSLRDNFAAGSNNHNRYDEFIMGITGWLYRISSAVQDYRDLVIENKNPAGRGDDLAESLREWRSEFNDFLEDCSGRLGKLARADNIEALRYYITDLILAGRGAEVEGVVAEGGLASRNNAFSDWDRAYFRALAGTEDAAWLREAIGTERPGGGASPYLKVYLKFLLGIRERDREILVEVAGLEAARVFALSYYPVTPFMPDGTIADDAILLGNCLLLRQRERMSADDIKEMLSDPLERYTGGSAFNILTAHISDAVTGDDFDEAVDEIVEFYVRNSGSDGIFWPR